MSLLKTACNWMLTSLRPMDFTLTLDFAVKRAQHPHQPLDAEAPEEGEDVEDMVAEARLQMRHVGGQTGVARAMSRLEDFQRSDGGEFSLAPNLRREVHLVHRNLGHPGNAIFGACFAKCWCPRSHH